MLVCFATIGSTHFMNTRKASWAALVATITELVLDLMVRLLNNIVKAANQVSQNYGVKMKNNNAVNVGRKSSLIKKFKIKHKERGLT